VLIGNDARKREAEHIADLCSRFDVDWAGLQGSHFSARLGDLSFTWERHGEFSGFTFAIDGDGDQPAGALLPAGWLSSLPGQTLVAAHAMLLPEPEGGVTPALLARHFGSNTVIGAEVGGGAALALTDFRIHDGGYSRVLLLDRSRTARQAGRSMQRLFEIEVYRMLALLALRIAQRQLGQVAAIEAELAALTGGNPLRRIGLERGRMPDRARNSGCRRLDRAGWTSGVGPAPYRRFRACAPANAQCHDRDVAGAAAPPENSGPISACTS